MEIKEFYNDLENRLSNINLSDDYTNKNKFFNLPFVYPKGMLKHLKSWSKKVHKTNIGPFTGLKVKVFKTPFSLSKMDHGYITLTFDFYDRNWFKQPEEEFETHNDIEIKEAEMLGEEENEPTNIHPEDMTLEEEKIAEEDQNEKE